MLRTRGGSILGSLLKELSWEGRGVGRYREGGHGLENVLTAEVLQGLDFLPRTHFLGEVLRAAHGTGRGVALLAEQVENAEIELLPGNYFLRPGDQDENGEAVQPDAIIESPDVCCLLEAKRIRRSQFGTRQLAREYYLVTRESEAKLPLLLLVLSAPPPVPVAGLGRLGIVEAIRLRLAEVYREADGHPRTLPELESSVPETVAWITWREIEATVSKQADSFASDSTPVAQCVKRLAGAVTGAVARHS